MRATIRIPHRQGYHLPRTQARLPCRRQHHTDLHRCAHVSSSRPSVADLMRRLSVRALSFVFPICPASSVSASACHYVHATLRPINVCHTTNRRTKSVRQCDTLTHCEVLCTTSDLFYTFQPWTLETWISFAVQSDRSIHGSGSTVFF